jgi:5,10-methylenetetrahydromethanopterin reductase
LPRPKFGLNRWDWSTPAAFAADVERAEDAGWDYALVGVNPLALWDPYVMLSMAAATTSRIHLGTLLENCVLDGPPSIASSIATVDAVSSGRALLGLGIGDTAVRFQRRDPATVGELEAATTMIRALLHGEVVGPERDPHFVLRHARPVPVWIAAGGPRTLRMAGRCADGVFIRVGRHEANLTHAVEQVHAGAREAGRDPNDVGIGLIFHTVVPDDADAVVPIVRAMAAGYYEYSPALFDIPGLTWDAPPAEDIKRGVIDDFHHAPDLVAAGNLVGFLDVDTAESFAVFGSPEQMAAQIDATLNMGFRVDLVVPHPVPLPVPHVPVPRTVTEDLAGCDYTTWFPRAVMPLFT